MQLVFELYIYMTHGLSYIHHYQSSFQTMTFNMEIERVTIIQCSGFKSWFVLNFIFTNSSLLIKLN